MRPPPRLLGLVLAVIVAVAAAASTKRPGKGAPVQTPAQIKQAWVKAREKGMCSRKPPISPPRIPPHPDMFWGYGVFDPSHEDRIPDLALQNIAKDFTNPSAQKMLLAEVILGVMPSFLTACVSGLVTVLIAYSFACSFCCCCRPRPPRFEKGPPKTTETEKSNMLAAKSEDTKKEEEKSKEPMTGEKTANGGNLRVAGGKDVKVTSKEGKIDAKSVQRSADGKNSGEPIKENKEASKARSLEKSQDRSKETKKVRSVNADSVDRSSNGALNVSVGKSSNGTPKARSTESASVVASAPPSENPEEKMSLAEKDRVRYAKPCEDPMYPLGRKLSSRKIALIVLIVLMMMFGILVLAVSAHATAIISKLVDRIDMDKQIDHLNDEIEHVVCKGDTLFEVELADVKKGFRDFGDRVPDMLLRGAPATAKQILDAMKEIIVSIESGNAGITGIAEFTTAKHNVTNPRYNEEVKKLFGKIDAKLAAASNSLKLINASIYEIVEDDNLRSLVSSRETIERYITKAIDDSYASMYGDQKGFVKDMVPMMYDIHASKATINNYVSWGIWNLAWMRFISLPSGLFVQISAFGCLIAVLIDMCTKRHLFARSCLCVWSIVFLVLVIVPALCMIIYVFLTRSAKLACMHVGDYSTMNTLAHSRLQTIEIPNMPEIENVVRNFDIGRALTRCSSRTLNMTYGAAMADTLDKLEPAVKELIERNIKQHAEPYINQLEDSVDKHKQMRRLYNIKTLIEGKQFTGSLTEALAEILVIRSGVGHIHSDISIDKVRKWLDKVQENVKIIQKNANAISSSEERMEGGKMVTVSIGTLVDMKMFLEELKLKELSKTVFIKVKELALKTVKAFVENMKKKSPRCHIATIYDNIRYQLCDPLSQPVTAAAGAQFLAMICNVLIGVIGVSVARFYVALHMRKTDPYKKCKKNKD